MTTWTKQDLLNVAASLKKKSIFLYNDIFFINADVDDSHLLSLLEPMAQDAGGAMAVNFDRALLKVAHEQTPCETREFLLYHSGDTEAFLSAVVFSGYPTALEKQEILLFILAHEIGHQVNDDCANMVPDPHDPARRNQERLADAFANQILGTNLPGIGLLNAYIGLIKASPEVANSPEQAERIIGLLQERVEWMS